MIKVSTRILKDNIKIDEYEYTFDMCKDNFLYFLQSSYPHGRLENSDKFIITIKDCIAYIDIIESYPRQRFY